MWKWKLVVEWKVGGRRREEEEEELKNTSHPVMGKNAN